MANKSKGRFEEFRSLNPSFAVLDENGTIVAVSQSWRAFALSAGLQLKDAAVGSNYLEYCTAEPRFLSALQQLIDGATASLTYVYPCPSPHKKHWFVVIGVPQARQASAPGRYFTLFHIDVTELIVDRVGEEADNVLSSFNRAIEISADDIIVDILRESISHVFEAPLQSTSPWTQLSPREFEVARLVAQQYSNKAIAEALQCSVHTVKRHVTAIMKKLRISERQEIVAWWKSRSPSDQS
jgi:DNA-binding CsgD family transcriptional regulator